MTRNERRKVAQARLAAKSARFTARVAAAKADSNRKVVEANLRSPIERNDYPQASIGRLGQGAPRFRESSNIARMALTGIDDRGRFHG